MKKEKEGGRNKMNENTNNEIINLTHDEIVEEYTEEGNTLRDLMGLKRMLAKDEWVQEAKQVPLGSLTPSEQKLIVKCINKDPLSDDELDELEVLLGRYRVSIQEQKPNETIQAVKDNVQHIKDCDTFLEKLEQVRKEEVTTIPFNIPTKDGLIAVELDVYPITDSSILFDPNSHFAAFMDQNEEITPDKINPSSLEDQQVQQEILEKSQQIIMEGYDGLELMIELLSKQTMLHGQPRNPEKMEKIYREMPQVYLAALSNRVQPLIIEPVYDVDMDKVFQEISD